VPEPALSDAQRSVHPGLLAGYALLAIVAVVSNFAGPFTGVGLLRAAPTVLLGLAAFLHTRARFGHRVTAAVLCGAAGDFFLASLSRDWLLPGLVAFFAGHVLYIAAFARGLSFSRGRLAALVAALFAMAVLTVFTVRHLAASGEPHLIAPGVAYVLVMAIMLAVCLLRRSPTPWIGLGALVFVVSDAHIAVNHQLLSSPLLLLTLTGYTTYYLAQFLLFFGAARECHR
jgi:uncharacterized membrane protein YhhN